MSHQWMPGERITETFIVDNFNKTNIQVTIFPNGNDEDNANFVSIFLQFFSYPHDFAFVTARFGISDSVLKNENVFTLRDIIDTSKAFGSPRLISRSTMLYSSNFTLNNDTIFIHIECFFLLNTHQETLSPLMPLQASNAARIIFRWKVCDIEKFDGLKGDYLYSDVIPSYKYGEIQNRFQLKFLLRGQLNNKNHPLFYLCWHSSTNNFQETIKILFEFSFSNGRTGERLFISVGKHLFNSIMKCRYNLDKSESIRVLRDFTTNHCLNLHLFIQSM